MGFQELCLLCYETQWLRHSKAERVAHFVLQFNIYAHVPDLAKLASQRPHMAR